MQKDRLKALSVVIPVYNELDNLEALYKEIATVLDAADFVYEVIFIDDGSTDGSQIKLKDLNLNFPLIKMISHRANYGQSAALFSGVKVARYSIIVSLDGDGQNDPADIPKLFELYQENSTIILGLRQKRDDSSLRKFSSWVGNTIRRRLLHDDCPDTGCSLKLFPRQAFLELPHFNHLHRFLPALFKRAGFKLIHVPVNHRARWHGQSKYGVMNRLFVGIHDLIGVHWLLKRPCAPEVLSDEC